MSYTNLEDCILDLEKNKLLIRIKEEVDPYLEMASIHLRIFEMGGPAILFEKIKGTQYRAVSNLFGQKERRKFIFRKTEQRVKDLIQAKGSPDQIFKNIRKIPNLLLGAYHAIPQRNDHKILANFSQIQIQDLPCIQHWENDGGAFVTLPQVYSENLLMPGIQRSNLGMYRIQLTGNEYNLNKEVGLHYQLHRGIGIHQTIAKQLNQPLKISCFVGGPPAHTVSAVMPLPENISEINFAGVLAGRKFRYGYEDGFCISTDADFIITGELSSDNKIEGPFGDHLGYYSLAHPFPYLKIHKVYAKKRAIWPFTVVGRPPQEDTAFGELIHELVGDIIKYEIPGLKAVQAVDESGVHPLLIAIGSERYTPYLNEKKPAEILTIAQHILGTGQLSLAKYLFITADETNQLSLHNLPEYFNFILERIDFNTDLHFITNTSIDTLDYSSGILNKGSKVIFAAFGAVKRKLCTSLPSFFMENSVIKNSYIINPGIISIEINKYQDEDSTLHEIQAISNYFKDKGTFLLDELGIAILIIADNAEWMSNFKNFLWGTFTRSNPAQDIYGIDSFIIHKHWGAKGPIIIDARIKPFHPPILEKNKKIEENVNKILSKYLL